MIKTYLKNYHGDTWCLFKHKETARPKSTLNSAGYGEAATEFMLLIEGHWYRVYARSYGNGCSHYVTIKGKEHFVEIERQ